MLKNLFNRKKSTPIQLKEKSIEEIKNLCNILFIDDHEFPIVEILRREGWRNTQKIDDVLSLNQKELRDAHIIFCDINGVGIELGLRREGIDLIIAIRQEYPDKKIIAYSGEDNGPISAFETRFSDSIDAALRKNADLYEFTAMIDKFARSCFSNAARISNIQQLLENETGEKIRKEQVEKILYSLQQNGSLEESTVSNVLNLSNAADITTLLKAIIGT